MASSSVTSSSSVTPNLTTTTTSSNGRTTLNSIYSKGLAQKERSKDEKVKYYAIFIFFDRINELLRIKDASSKVFSKKDIDKLTINILDELPDKPFSKPSSSTSESNKFKMVLSDSSKRKISDICLNCCSSYILVFNSLKEWLSKDFGNSHTQVFSFRSFFLNLYKRCEELHNKTDIGLSVFKKMNYTEVENLRSKLVNLIDLARPIGIQAMFFKCIYNRYRQIALTTIFSLAVVLIGGFSLVPAISIFVLTYIIFYFFRNKIDSFKKWVEKNLRGKIFENTQEIFAKMKDEITLAEWSALYKMAIYDSKNKSYEHFLKDPEFKKLFKEFKQLVKEFKKSYSSPV